MEFEYDPAKRRKVLEERGLDIARAGEVFEGFHLHRADDGHSTADEMRYIELGMIDDRVVIVAWTRRGKRHRIITMWKASSRERERYFEARDRAG